MNETVFPEPSFKPDGDHWHWNETKNYCERPISAKMLSKMTRQQEKSPSNSKFHWDANVKEIHPPFYIPPME